MDIVHAILAPPELERFRELTGVGDSRLDVRVDGWSKLAILTDDRVFLFPRRGREASLLHGTRAAVAAHARGVAVAPRVLECWEDPRISFSPFVAVERVHGDLWIDVEGAAPYAEVQRVITSLGAAIATWHSVATDDLGDDLRHPPAIGPKPHLDSILAGDLNVDALEDAAVAAELPASVVSIWLQALAPVAAMRPVFLHGDVCENQLIVDADRRVAAVLDWDTAGVGHPLHDFDFGEWGVGIFAWETHFADLRHRMWAAYCGGASAQPAPAAAQVHLAFTVSDLLHFAGRRAHGALDAWGERRWRNLVAEIGPATEAALEQV